MKKQRWEAPEKRREEKRREEKRREEKRREEKRRDEKRREEKRREEKRREEGREEKKEDKRRKRVRRKKMQVHKKVGKSLNTVFPIFWGSGGSKKIRRLKRRVRSHLGRWEMKKCTPLRREAHFEVRMYKAIQNASTSEHFWKLRCRKSARGYGAKHMSK